MSAASCEKQLKDKLPTTKLLVVYAFFEWMPGIFRMNGTGARRQMVRDAIRCVPIYEYNIYI